MQYGQGYNRRLHELQESHTHSHAARCDRGIVIAQVILGRADRGFTPVSSAAQRNSGTVPAGYWQLRSRPT